MLRFKVREVDFTKNHDDFEYFNDADFGAKWEENEGGSEKDAHPSEGPASL